MLGFTSIQFKASDYPDDPTNYLDGCVGDKYQATIDFYIQKAAFDKVLVFDSATKTITNGNNLDFTSFIEDIGLLIGETFIVPDSVDNDTVLTITGLTDRVITVSNVLTDETTGIVNLYVTNYVTAIDFLFNLLPNGSVPNFNSLVDINFPQKFIATEINPAGSVPVYFKIGTTSFAWVTDTVSGRNTVTTKITPTGITGDYKQKFTIVHNFVITPIGIASQLNNLEDNIPPYGPLQYICQINAKYEAGNNIQNTGQLITPNGTSAWFNQSQDGSLPEYSIESIEYIDPATEDILPCLDSAKPINVTIKILSASGLFTAPSGMLGTQIIVGFFYLPLAGFQNNPDTLQQNFLFDTAKQNIGAAAINGVNFGTNYQVLKNVICTLVDDEHCTITFEVNFSEFIQNLLAGKAPNDRNYGLTVNLE